MILKVGDDYIDQRIEITIERKARLFEAIGDQQGDFSYAFTLDDTADTRRKLGITTVNQKNKSIYRRINSSLLSDAGTEIYNGFVRIERIDSDGINCSFFSGNSNWIDALSIPLRDLDFSKFDKKKNLGTIENSWPLTSGIVFPLVDKGNLSTRGSYFLYSDDFHPFIFVKNIFDIISYNTGIKFTGDLFTNSRFTSLITSNNGISGIQKRIEERSVYVGKTGTQTIVSFAGFTKVTFTNESGVFYDSTIGNWNTAQSHYVSDESLDKVKVEYNLIMLDQHYTRTRVIKNGSQVLYQDEHLEFVSKVNKSLTIDRTIDPGDTIEVQMEVVFANHVVQPNSWVKIAPIKFKTAFVDSIVPNKTASEFISDVFRMFNIVTSYDSFSKTVMCNSFKSIYNKPAVDLSNYIDSYTDDYIDFINSYAKLNGLNYSQQLFDEVEQYNESNDVGYGDGVVTIDNDHLEQEGDIFDLDFVAPFQRFINSFATSLPYLGYADVEEVSDQARTITSVTDDGSGNAEFNWTSGGPTTDIIGTSLVRISNSSNPVYNGDFMVSSVTSSSVVLLDVPFDTDATATMSKIDLVDVDNEDQVILLWQPETTITNFAGIATIYIGGPGVVYQDIAFAFFYFPDIGENFNYGSKKQALYFDRINDVSAIQTSIIEDEFVEISRILNDPVKIIAEMHIPEHVFAKLDFVTPVRIRTKDFDAKFFVNLITGYEGSHLPCTVELIMLS